MPLPAIGVIGAWAFRALIAALMAKQTYDAFKGDPKGSEMRKAADEAGKVASVQKDAASLLTKQLQDAQDRDYGRLVSARKESWIREDKQLADDRALKERALQEQGGNNILAMLANSAMDSQQRAAQMVAAQAVTPISQEPPYPSISEFVRGNYLGQ